MNTNLRRVLISGGGISGLAVAGALARNGVSVDIVEARDNLTVTGIGISVPNNALRMLNELGVLEETVAAGHTFDEYVMRDATGAHITSLPCPPSADGVPGYLGITRTALSEILRTAATSAGARLRLGVRIEEFTEDTDAARVRLSDGTTAEYDVVVGCEGLRSPLRTRLFGEEHGPVFTGYSCWRAKPKMPRRVPGMTKFHGATTDAGLVPLNEDEMYLFHVTAEPGNPHHAPSEWRNLLEDRLAEYTGLIAEVCDNLPPAEEIIYSPLFEVRLPAPWHTARAVVIGDAAHAVVPHLSQGGSQALEDAVVLADELLHRPVTEALPAFTERRFARAHRVQSLSSAMLTREMTGPPANPGSRGTNLRQEMADIRAYLDQPV